MKRLRADLWPTPVVVRPAELKRHPARQNLGSGEPVRESHPKGAIEYEEAFLFCIGTRYHCGSVRHHRLCRCRDDVIGPWKRRRIRGQAQRSVDEFVWREESRSLRVDLANAAAVLDTIQLALGATHLMDKDVHGQERCLQERRRTAQFRGNVPFRLQRG